MKTQNVKRKTSSFAKATKDKQNLNKAPASTMAQLLAKSLYQPNFLKRGQRITATVSSITPKQILLDIGGKAEAVVLERDRKMLSDLLKTIKVGDSVQASVLDPESDYGYPLVSLRAFMSNKSWEALKKIQAEDGKVQCEISEVTRGGIIVDVLGLAGFIPASHLSDGAEGGNVAAGLRIEAKILELDPSSNRLVLSQKLASFKAKDLEKILSQIEIGKTYKGVVAGITKFGIFVTLVEGSGIDFSKSPIEGLVHISEVSWEKVSELDKLFSLGDEVEVMVIGVDKKNKKLNLSLKQLMQDPFDAVAKKLSASKDTQVRGVVSRVTKFGVFVTIESGLPEGVSGVEGLIHQSKISPGTEFLPGEKISCTIESVDTKKRRIALVPVLKEKPVGYR